MRVWRVLPVAVAFVAVAFASGTPAPAAQADVVHADLRLGYTCRFPAGPQPVDVRITADFPSRATVNEPIQPTAIRVALTLPALTDLPNAATVTAIVRLDTTATQRESQALASWSGALAEPVPVPADANLVLDTPAEPPPVLVPAPGDVVFAAGDLAATLTGYQADGTVTDPPSLDLSCVLGPDQAATLGTVPVSDVDSPSTGPAPPPPPGAVAVEPRDKGERAPLGTTAVQVPADCQIIDPPPGPKTAARYCAYVTGYANVAKLNASVLQPAGINNIGPTALQLRCKGDLKLLCQQANLLARLDGEPKMPAAPAWLLPFGFVPSKATMQLTQLGLGFADIVGDTNFPPARSLAVITGTYTARLSAASVNGVPLDLGPDCRTETPIDIRLEARPPYTLTLGGVMSGMVTIPPFTGCGVTEDLDPLITGLVSGPGNFVKLTQGRICTLTGAGTGCPPIVPTPQT
ncbi:DUF6801 domain-containing protein [Actinophytocola sp.]|uniref:DUF6801 domain-containing protein n=1 Tax=Actinophytocola sp. TaxID=1872138 RepID=UPI002ED7EA15